MSRCVAVEPTLEPTKSAAGSPYGPPFPAGAYFGWFAAVLWAAFVAAELESVHESILPALVTWRPEGSYQYLQPPSSCGRNVSSLLMAVVSPTYGPRI